MDKYAQIVLFSVSVFTVAQSLESGRAAGGLSVSNFPLPPVKPHVGVVQFDYFYNFMGQGQIGEEAAVEALVAACSRGFAPVRFAASLFWPVDLAMWNTNRTMYINQFKKAVQKAEEHNCTLLPSLAWNWFAFSDLNKEPLGQAMRNTSSKTRAFLEEYITTLVSETDGSPAIGGWELGNELNLIVDLNLTMSQIHPPLGTPTAPRPISTNFSTADMMNFESWMYSVIRNGGGSRKPVSTGHAVPRQAAWHLRQSYTQPERDWTLDTVSEFKKNFLDQQQCCELASFHFYANHGAFFNKSVSPNSTLVADVAREALRESNRKKRSNSTSITTTDTFQQSLYIGEFGDPDPGERPWTRKILQYMKNLETPQDPPTFGTVWVWEFNQTAPHTPAKFSLNPNFPPDSAIIEDMIRFNKKIL